MQFYSTQIKGDADSNYQKMIEIYHMAFPLAIEEKYVALANAINKYFEARNELLDLNQNQNRDAIELNKIKKIIDQKDKRKNQIQSSLNEINQQIMLLLNSGIFSPEVYEQIENLTDRGKNLLQEMENVGKRVQNKHDEKQKSLFDNHNAANDMRNNLEQSIQGIIKSLQDVRSSNIGDSDRIDGLQITNRHIEMFDTLNCSETVKTTLKNVFISQFNFRTQAFKTLQIYALQVIDNYNKRDINITEDLLYNKVIIANLGLYYCALGDELFSKDVDWNYFPSFVLQNRNKECTALNFATQYLKEGTVSLEQLDYFVTEVDKSDAHLGYGTAEILRMLHNESLNSIKDSSLEHRQSR